MDKLNLDFLHATEKIIREEIIEIIKGHDIIIFGAGESGLWAKELLDHYNISICAFCDNSKAKQGREKVGFEILSLENAMKKFPEAYICVASMYWHEIREQIEKFSPVLINRTFNILSTMNWETIDRAFVSTEKEYIEKHLLDFEMVYDMLEDDESKNVLLNILNFRLTRKDQYIADIKSNEKTYLDETILSPKDVEYIYDGIIIDGGAFDGDTVKFFFDELACDNKKLTIYAFELSEENCEKIKKIETKHNCVKVFRNALWRSSGEKVVLGGEELSGRVQTGMLNKGNYAETVCLDDFLSEKISFIKLDVEGAERDVLLGANEIIKNHKPIMAISAYHLQDDIISLFAILKSYSDEYQFYLRHYLYSSGETVLYAIPKRKR